MLNEQQSVEKGPNKSEVYFVNSPSDETVLVGMDVNINEQQKLIGWFDTTKERLMHFDTVADEDSNISFTRSVEEGGGDYNFQPMTLDIYNEKVKSKLLAPHDFDNEEALKQSFLETKSTAW